jgi:hypothetical protein
MAAVFRYPFSAITEQTDYLQLDIVKYTAVGSGLVGSRGNSRGNRSNTVNANVSKTKPAKSGVGALNSTIVLPMPSNIQDGNSVRYSDDSLNGIAASAVEKVTEVMEGSYGTGFAGAIKETGEKFSEFFASTGEDVRKIMIRSLAAQAVNVFGGNITPDQILARQQGDIFNPNMELLFNGVTLRSFKFSFKMTPRSEDEAKQVRAIIKTLKKNMAPIYTDTTYLTTPNIFELRYRKGGRDHPFLHRFKQCALTDINVNYTGENVYATYGGDLAAPVSMIMDLTFKELEPIYNEDYTDGDDQGVGF